MSGRGQPLRISGRVIRDPVDLRDLIYRPSLALLPEQFLCAGVDPSMGGFNKLQIIRNQGKKPTCIGEALAALIDIQRIETFRKSGDFSSARKAVKPASAAMLHAMALEIEQAERDGPVTDICNLRSGLKGFYNTGVCTEDTWSLAKSHRWGVNNKVGFDSATVEIMREARNVTLGAYYRVRSLINDYHAAILEAGALYVAAELHSGWAKPKNGIIVPGGEGQPPAQGHAFVIVGYNRDGFLVLNSWGEDWGGYVVDGGNRLGGVALWRYEDWATCVLDCWVLRLAAPTPNSFRHALGTQGLTGFAASTTAIASPSVRRLEVLGRYLHLSDGSYATGGSYPSSRRSFETTLRHLLQPGKDGGAKDFDVIRLIVHGDASSTDDVMNRLQRSIYDDKKCRVHGIAMDWVNGLLNGAAVALQPLFQAALKIAKGNREDANRQIEQMTRPVGRALWRDAKHAARRAADIRGDAAHAFVGVINLCRTSGKPLHIVSEGAGALLLTELLASSMRKRSACDALSKTLASLTLVAPLCRQDDFDRGIGPFLDYWAKVSGHRAVLFKADAAFDGRLAVADYARSWTDLVSNAFEEVPGPLISSAAFKTELLGNPEVRLLAPPMLHAGELEAAHVLQHDAVCDHVRREIEKSKVRTGYP